ncbi:hypothetical protein [Halodesulfovibrio marinisediminis]|uniref:Uncharacterized protein n=1 Tax=Halodesulfovibrio marinisediminis DSM 17456 TaxID=1121457 RepID=A0A1N6FQI5_9BACT|nr:hypothetical protein [Halodesulfovibrio marinisediminis]SIN97519.1 hypothetical protein SAMN02745161_1449 [Halodesulfovibrio marinisediminis DSM 17456]
MDDLVSLIDPIGLFGLTSDENAFLHEELLEWVSGVMTIGKSLVVDLPSRSGVIANTLKYFIEPKRNGGNGMRESFGRIDSDGNSFRGR